MINKGEEEEILDKRDEVDEGDLLILLCFTLLLLSSGVRKGR